MGQSDKILLRVEEVAERMSLGRTKIFELIRRGDLPVIHEGRRTLIPARALEVWMNERLNDVR